MPRPTHVLDVVLAPADPDLSPEPATLEALWDALVGAAYVTADGAPGGAADALVAGGFARARLDRPGGVTLYANQQGGFRVTCPHTGASVVPGFQQAMTAWRVGGPRALTCPACGEVHPLEALGYAPPAAFGRVALVLADAADAAPTPEGLALVTRHLGPVRVVGRRP